MDGHAGTPANATSVADHDADARSASGGKGPAAGPPEGLLEAGNDGVGAPIAGSNKTGDASNAMDAAKVAAVQAAAKASAEEHKGYASQLDAMNTMLVNAEKKLDQAKEVKSSKADSAPAGPAATEYSRGDMGAAKAYTGDANCSLAVRTGSSTVAGNSTGERPNPIHTGRSDGEQLGQAWAKTTPVPGEDDATRRHRCRAERGAILDRCGFVEDAARATEMAGGSRKELKKQCPEFWKQKWLQSLMVCHDKFTAMCGSAASGAGPMRLNISDFKLAFHVGANEDNPMLESLFRSNSNSAQVVPMPSPSHTPLTQLVSVP